MKHILCILLILSSLCLPIQAQVNKTFVIEGTVLDETDIPLPGATVYLRDKVSIGTSTNSEGKFSIRASENDVIIFSFVGYESIEYLAKEEKKDLIIKFKEQAAQLDEVVVVGMGTQRKISSVAAVSSVNVEELQTPATSITNLLGGRVPGVISMQTSGEPGRNISEFWVRGIGTFGANSSALVLIDGLEGNINSIDPADIESFSVLKDASATAVYGVRGANGVVLITTKRGQAGKLSITGRVNYSLSRLNRTPDYLGAYDYALLANEARSLRNEDPIYSDVELDIINDGSDPDLYPDVNWQDEVLKKNGFRQAYYVSARGGAQVARYFMSLGFSNEDAAYNVDKNSVYATNVGYNTYTYRANIDLELSPSTTLYFGTDGFLSDQKDPGVASTDYIWYAQSNINPLLLPKKYSNGQFPATGTGSLTSPLVQINYMGSRTNQAFNGKFTLALDQDFSMLLKGLSLKAQGAYDIDSYFWENRLLNPALYQAVGRDQKGELITIQRVQEGPISYGKGTNQYRKYHFESTLNYEQIFASDHRVSGLVYYYISDEKWASNATNNLTAIPLRYQGVSSRFTYGFRDTYMVDVNFGYTGSENFQPGRQYGFFPSLAIGWVPSNYDFFQKGLPWFNFLKFRGSYGTVGNDRISNLRFPYLTMVDLGSGRPWGTSAALETIGETRIGADNLQWEKAIKANLGIEGRLFKERFSFVIDIFNDQRDGIFMQRVQVPDYAGLITTPYSNIGKMSSFGSDGNVAFTENINEDMSFAIRGNFTYSRNNVQHWEEANPAYPYQEASGYPYGTIRGYHAIGLFKDWDDVENSPTQFGTVMPGDIKYRDVNGDGVINSNDRTPLSYSTYPLLMYGFGGEFRYKELTVGVLFKGTGKTDYFHVGYSGNGIGYVPFFRGVNGNVLSIVKDPANRWITKEYALENGIDLKYAENPNARYPRMTYGYNENNSQLSDFWKGDARYLRLQEVTINYNLKNDFLRKLKITSIDLQLVGNNLFLWDKVKLFDPEQAHRNGEVYPIPTTYAFQMYINL
ncbi:MAG: TonB-dependent receptor [Dysgonamonadaceae bacterium]|jgi:TonB-linked SusC/RagA family outer membrane protein|nr:TonB-dependent receptor [Dysgonamonadaceae bacterium]MDD3309371.1 TonB-dependent receptor [Dysgonamonadaceae bacterium]MDD3900376.1 TonB-dependent receptor [Dysgonamonadaceae bacterium]MDD4399006.1 TonB-dependent receptor [Dysgonamonadaceae bacterium]MEA5081667.1 TonB-dependent receptor [Dysgonamonadaceae bacterium]